MLSLVAIPGHESDKKPEQHGRIDRLTRVERESLRAAATRNLAECCDECRDLLRAQLRAEENRVDTA